MVAEQGSLPTALPGLSVPAQLSIIQLIDSKLELRLDTGANNINSMLQRLDDSVDTRITTAVGQLRQEVTALSLQTQTTQRYDDAFN